MYKLANEFGTTVNRIIVANPNIDIYNLVIGRQIIIPVGDIVKTNINYNSNILLKDVNDLKIVYPFLEIGEIGRSVLGKPLVYIRIGQGNREVFYNGAFHANEWITTPVLMKFVEEYSRAFVNRSTIYGYNARALFYSTSLYIVPMVNPDGVDLVTGSIKNVENAYKKAQEISSNFPDIPFPSGWKANINGVDLNLQFPAGWENAREIKYSQGFNKPAPRDFVGYGPLTEPESKAVYNFTLQHNFRLVIAYHTQGEEIYWKFQNFNPPNSEYIGRQFAASSGYLLADTPYNSSFAGYKDWFIQSFNRPGYTIEAGMGENPLPISQFDNIYENNIGILTLGLVNS
ncbi:MAG: LysM peptidoglycan-binding domain-containing protein [Clostridia bacterium]|nr:LysM peptidoglycan-binding domain-containing protein [Clostridia bacterium]